MRPQDGVTKDGKIYALPFDTHTWLWHINMNLFKQAGLVDAAGKPILPKSADELLAQAAQFKEKTGKPYFVQTLANETAFYTRTFDTLLYPAEFRVLRRSNAGEFCHAGGQERVDAV